MVVPYIGTWIETIEDKFKDEEKVVVPYIGTWIETTIQDFIDIWQKVVPYIGTWIETVIGLTGTLIMKSYLI